MNSLTLGRRFSFQPEHERKTAFFISEVSSIARALGKEIIVRIITRARVG